MAARRPKTTTTEATTATSQSESANTWQSSIVGYDKEYPVAKLLGNPDNLRVHSDAQLNTLTGLLETITVIQNVIVNVRSGMLVDGHARLYLAKKHGQPTLPVTLVDLDEATESLAIATFDAVGGMAENDPAKLIALLRKAVKDPKTKARLLNSAYASYVSKCALAFISPKVAANFHLPEDAAPEQIFEALCASIADAEDLTTELEDDEVDDSDAFHRDNPFVDKARDWKDTLGEELNITHCMQVFVDNSDWPELQAMLTKLAGQWDIDTQTDTVIECIRRGYRNDFGDEPALEPEEEDIPVLA